MKKWCRLIPMILLIIGCAGNAKSADKSAADSGLITLDQALKEAAARIDERIAAGSKIALLNFNSPHDKFSGYVLDDLTANLVDSGKLTVVDRKDIDLIRSEIDFQYSGEVADESMQAVGRRLGAQSIISGSLTDMGGFYRIVVRVLNVQSAKVEVQHRANIANDNITAALLTGGKTSGTANTQQRAQTAQTPAAPVAPAAPAAPVAPPVPVYKIGDKGPAGGIVFYDKGNDSGGWRYLEAAPANTEFQSQWGGESVYHIDGINVDVGSGKSNTQRVAALFEDRGEIGRAAHRCLLLNINGYNDWFLPSKNELGWMYINLKERGLGNFSGARYWSSSFAGRDPWNNSRAWVQRFSDGTQESSEGYSGRTGPTHTVRAIRQF